MPAIERAASALLVLLAAAPAAAGTLRRDPGSDCALDVPETEAALSHRWTGPCGAGGAAEGVGGARLYRGGALVAAFLGRAAAGRWALGVRVEGGAGLAGGFAADRFDENALAPPPAAPAGVDAAAAATLGGLRAGEAAARALAARYRRAGNAASAAHYEGLARELAAQAD